MKGTAIALLVALSTVAFAVNPSQLSISDKSVGPISTGTKFDQKEVQSLLPGLMVKQKMHMTEAEEYPTLVISDATSTLATINPTEDRSAIFSIQVTDSKVINSLGPKIGTKYGEVYGASIHESCEPGMEEMSGSVACRDPKSKHVSYVFRGTYNGPDGEVPPIAVLKSFSISEIVWKP